MVLVQVKFGDLAFPINPQKLSRSYKRAIARKNLLGGKQVVESRQASLTRLTLEGILTGTAAKATMDSLEIMMYAKQVKLLTTPTYPGGEEALLVSLEFSIEKLYRYDQYIPYIAEFIIVPSTKVKIPVWSLHVQDEEGVYQNITDVIELSVERQWGPQAAAFSFKVDNSRGQYTYPFFDYGRNVKITMGYENGRRTRYWGLIDYADYTISKDEGSSVSVVGRDYGQRLLEGTNLNIDMQDDEHPPEEIIRKLLDGSITDYDPVNLQRYPPTGLGFINTPPNWAFWGGRPEGPNAFGLRLHWENMEIMEIISKINTYYKMECYINAGEMHDPDGAYDDSNWSIPPSLVWFDKPRITGLTQNAIPGNPQHIYVEDPALFSCVDWLGNTAINTIFITDLNNRAMGLGYETAVVIAANPEIGRLTLDHPLTNTYNISNAAFITSSNAGNSPSWAVAPLRFIWGNNISSINTRVDGIPMRNRIAVMSGSTTGVFVVADSEQPNLLSATGLLVMANPGHITGDPVQGTYSPQAKYGVKRKYITDGSYTDEWRAGVAAYTDLLKLGRPEIVVKINSPGSPYNTPGAFVSIMNNNGTRIEGGYLLVGVKESMEIGNGYTAELTCRRTIQSISPDLLGGILKLASKTAAGSSSVDGTPAHSTTATVLELFS